MAVRHLKKIRVAVAILVFAPAVLMFVDFGRVVPADIAAWIARVQFVPSLLLGTAFLAAFLPLVAITLLTLAFGRVYCSTLCPLGTLQDVVIRLSTTRRRRRRFRFARSFTGVHLAVFGATVLLAMLGSMFLLNLTEPFSNFGRIFGVLGRPVAAALLNQLARLLGKQHIYAIASVQMPHLDWAILAVTGAWLFGIVVLSVTKGRLFCNLLCPAGAILRLVSRFSVFRMAIDENACTGCGLCEKICKARCIDSKVKKIDAAACVSCFNCVDICPTDGVTYRPILGLHGSPAEAKSGSPDTDHSRRVLLAGGAAMLGAIAAKVSPAAVSTTKRRRVVTPPGSLRLEHFSSRCTACHLCVGICPTQVLRPSLFEPGIGILQPRLVYDHAACMYECNACGQVCPTGAILPVPLEEKKLIRTGLAHFFEERCVVVVNGTACGACAEHCPTRAVEMVPYRAGLTIPRVNGALCVGCGACEHPCPVEPTKAMLVEGISPHERAEKLESKEIEKALDSADDFPF